MNLSRQRCKHIRSNILGKVPLPEQIDYGEIAINYSDGSERLYIKNTSNNIISFTSDAQKDKYELFNQGHKDLISLSNILPEKRLNICNLYENSSFSINGIIKDGYEMHFIIKNASQSIIVISLPSQMPYVLFGADSITIDPGKYIELNIISDGTNMYIRTI